MLLRRRGSAVLLALLLAVSADAQTEPTPIEPGARALLFKLGPELLPVGFNGATVSIKWHQTEASARRLGLTVFADARVDGGDVAQNTQQVDVRGDLVFLTYRRSRTPVYLYHGLGPTASVSVFRSELDVPEGGSGPTSAIRQNYEVGLGAAGVLGVEWAVASAVSLVGEYTTAVTGTLVYRSDSRDDLAQTFGGVGLRVSPGARVGVSVYF